MKDIKEIKKDDLIKLRDKKEVGINALPEYKIRTMKDDLAELTPSLEKIAKKAPPPEKLPVAPPLPKAPLPGTEELITEKKEIPKPPSAKLEKPSILPPKPKKKPKLLIILIIIFLILLGIAGFFYWQGTKEKPEPEPEPPITQEPEPPPSLITVDETKIISLATEISLFRLLEEESELDQPIGAFKRIAILENETEFLSLRGVFNKLRINIPPYALEGLEENYTLLLYNQNGAKRLCLIVEVESPENLKEQLRFWEETMVEDLKNFFLGQVLGESATPDFQDNVYKEIPIRYLNFPEPDLTIDYAVLEDVFILTTSRESIYKIIDRIGL